MRLLVLTLIAGCGIAASFAVPASAAQRPTAATARLDAKGLALVDTYLERTRSANTRAETVDANATAKRIFKHVRGASARYDRRSIDTIATYVVRARMPELQANLGSNLTVYNDALGFVTKSNLFELMRLSPDVLRRIRDGGTTIHIGDRPITTMAGMGGLAGTAVRGHEAGERWEDIGGAYNLTDNAVAAGRGNASYERYVGTILHELGHAYDAKTKRQLEPGVPLAAPALRPLRRPVLRPGRRGRPAGVLRRPLPRLLDRRDGRGQRSASGARPRRG